MIKVKVQITQNHYSYLEVKGHAGFGEKGKDLICAAVSSIIFGLIKALADYPAIRIEDLHDCIVITNNNTAAKVEDYFELTLIQLQLIAEHYDQYLRIDERRN